MTIKSMTASLFGVAAAVIAFGVGAPAFAEGELNLYSSRHYDTDDRLYTDFEKLTGITINRIEGKADALIERMKAEGAASPADVLLTVDAGRIWRAEQAGLLQQVESDVLGSSLPAHLRHPDNLWFSVSQRVRMIFFNPETVAEPPATYEDLADPKYKGMVCARSSSNIYMLSLMASIIAHKGEEAAKNWAAGLKANFARDPAGGDTDQLRGIVSGECQIAIANSYYFARALRKNVKDLSSGIEKIRWVFPNQSDRGAHVNVSVAGVAKHAPNRANAVKFIEYLTSVQAQKFLAQGNDEYPAVPGVELSEELASLGLFRQDSLNLSKLGENQPLAQLIYAEVGYK